MVKTTITATDICLLLGALKDITDVLSLFKTVVSATETRLQLSDKMATSLGTVTEGHLTKSEGTDLHVSCVFNSEGEYSFNKKVSPTNLSIQRC